MKRVLLIVVVIAIFAVVIHDFGKWFNTRSALRNQTIVLADTAAASARNLTREQAGREIAAQAQPKGIRVYQYGQDETTVQVYTETDVTGTWVLGPVIALTQKVPFKAALVRPFPIRDYASSQYR